MLNLEDSLQNIDNACAHFVGNRAQHVALSESIFVVQNEINRLNEVIKKLNEDAKLVDVPQLGSDPFNSHTDV